MGCGKSSLLKQWQNSYDGPSGDLDELIALYAGVEPQKLGQWIKQVGFEKFRAVETEILAKLLKEHDRYILSLGGGAFHPGNQILFKNRPNAETLWIETPVDVCWRRVKDDENRPLVAEGEVAFKELYQQRVAHYRRAKYRLLGNEEWPDFTEFCKKYNLKSLIHG
jgi:shikimate kinase